MILASETKASIEDVISVVHDLRNPLTTILSSAEMLVEAGLSEAQMRRIAQNVFCASIRMRELLEEVLDRSKAWQCEWRSCDVVQVVAGAVNEVAVTADFQSVEIVQHLPERLIVASHQRLVRRVLVNLLVNALEAMPQGGLIRVSALSEEQSVILKVRDTGPGITPAIRTQLFQPFVTAGKSGGIGLGLAPSRQVLHDLGGEIWVEPTSSGACFAVRLPSAAGERV